MVSNLYSGPGALCIPEYLDLDISVKNHERMKNIEFPEYAVFVKAWEEHYNPENPPQGSTSSLYEDPADMDQREHGESRAGAVPNEPSAESEEETKPPPGQDGRPEPDPSAPRLPTPTCLPGQFDPAEDGEDFKKHIAMAQAAYNADRYKDSVTHFTKASALDELSAHHLRQLAASWRHLGNRPMCEATYAKATELHEKRLASL